MNTNHHADFLLKVEGLTKVYGHFNPESLAYTGPDFNSNICPVTGSIVACADISFELYPAEVLGLVGESGSGKSTIIKLLHFDLEATKGEVYFRHYENAQTNILTASKQKMRHIRNHLVSMVYQNPRDGLNFSYSSGGNIGEKLMMGGNFHVQNIRQIATKLLQQTEVPAGRLDESPANFSGGMQQRVQIAKAIANNPPLLFLDEVTTGLDLSVQARVLDMIRNLQQELGISMIVVSHDLRVIKMLTDRTIVLKNGRIAEQGLTDQILQDPQHEYTQLLVNSLL